MPLERMQILITSEQRRRLVELSQRREEPVTALIREAIEVAFPAPVERTARAAAARFLVERPAPYVPSLIELDEALTGRFDLPTER